MTVAELIALLQKVDGSLPVVIRDADTDWLLTVKNVTEETVRGSESHQRKTGPTHVELSGYYGDEFNA